MSHEVIEIDIKADKEEMFASHPNPNQMVDCMICNF